jgi:hypothetical protein
VAATRSPLANTASVRLLPNPRELPVMNQTFDIIQNFKFNQSSVQIDKGTLLKRSNCFVKTFIFDITKAGELTGPDLYSAMWKSSGTKNNCGQEQNIYFTPTVIHLYSNYLLKAVKTNPYDYKSTLLVPVSFLIIISSGLAQNLVVNQGTEESPAATEWTVSSSGVSCAPGTAAETFINWTMTPDNSANYPNAG